MIHIFCALPCEAEPIIQYFKLTGLKQYDLFRLYQSKNKQISLTITGIGKLNSASAVSYHHACIETQISNIWLNIGVAGHATIPVGEARLINKITDKQNKSCWYPQILFKSPCDNASLITLDTPSTDYQESIFDMEASGFYQMAIRLGTAELIHSLKIISDNHEQSTSTINAKNIKKLITAHTGTIDTILDTLQPFSLEVASINTEPEHYQTLIEQWHFTQSEQVQLSRLLRLWAVRFSDEDVIDSVSGLKTGKLVLSALTNKFNKSEFVIYD
jgi:hypothetical protein